MGARKNISRKLQFKIGMRLGILKTIAKSIYSSPILKIREAVANSMDNKATWFSIYADRSTQTLSFFDNGTGINKEKFQEIFNSLGYGIYRADKYSNSYFGLGLMSIIQLGGKTKIFSRAINREGILMLEVDSEKVFDEKNENQPLEFLKQCIKLKTSSLSERDANSPFKVEYIKKIMKDYPETFTEIIIENMPLEVFEELTSSTFEFDIRKTLPLKPHEKDPFLLSIKDLKVREWIKQTLNSKEYCPTIDVYFGIEQEQEIKELKKYFPDFRQDLTFGSTNILYGTSKNKDFAYYIIFTTEDLESRLKQSTETGFWVRSRNFLVKQADFFQEPGSRKKFIHEPLKNWLFGEIFHININHFLVVTRDDYVWSSPDFISFRQEIIDKTSYLNQQLRKTWEYGGKVVNSIVTPIREIDQESGPFLRAKDTLTKMGIKSDSQEINKIFQKLKDKRKPELEKEGNRIDKLLEESKAKIILTDDENSLVIIDPSIKKEDLFTQSVEPDTNRVIVKISPQLFSPKKVMFLDKTFDLYFMSGRESDLGFSVDTDNNRIFVNVFNHDVMRYTVSFLDIYIAVELADIWSKNKEEMKHYILRLLGKEFPDSTRYLTSLADDLRRKKRS